MRIGKPVTAAAAKVTVSNNPSKQVKESPLEDRLWDAYDRLPELHFGSNTRANVARRFDYFPARRSTPVSEPERIGQVEDNETVPTADKAIVDVFEREGGADLLRRLTAGLVVHWDVIGKAYVVAEGTKETRTWKVYSTRELKKRTDKKGYDRLDSSGEIQTDTEPIDADNVFVVWRPHPRNSRRPDSPLRSSLEVAEQLILLNREMRARSLSRIAAGILFISDGMDFTDANDENIPVESFEQMLMDRLTRPIADAGSAAAVAPWVLKAAIEDIEAARHMTFDRDWEVSREDRDELRKRLAVGMDLPPEVIEGIADLNHWSAWQIQETTVSQHVDPTVRDILDSLSKDWFVPILLASNLDEGTVDGVVLWRDLTPAVVPADNSDQHFTALRGGLIGFQATRERLGYDEDEAPSMEELELIGWLVGRGNPSTGVPVDIDGEEPDGTPLVPDDDGPDQSDPLPDTEDDREATTQVTVFQQATVPTTRIIDLGDLAVQDQATLDYVLTEAEAAVDRLTEKAAARVRSKTQGRSAFASLRDLPDLALLQSAAADEFATNELIKDEDLTPIIARIRRRLARAQDQARDTFAQLVEAEPQPRSPDEDTDLDEGLTLLTAILLAAAAAALTTPGADPDPVDVGELRDLRIPVTEIRDALSTVGGGIPEYSDTVSWELIGNGRRTQQRLSNVGASSLEYRWLYGDPASRVSNFDPHRRLNNVTFTEWDDPALSVTADGSWVGVSHYRPGDHRGCLCQYRRTVTLPLPVAASG